MIPNSTPWAQSDRVHHYTPVTHDTLEQRAICLACTLPPTCDDPRCQFLSETYRADRLKRLDRRVAYLAHLIVLKPVYRIDAAIREKLRR